MLKKIAKDYLRLFSSAGRILVLFAACLGISFALVWPLWKFATGTPEAYTYTVLSVSAALLLYYTVKKIRKYQLRQILAATVKTAVVAAGIFFCIMSVLDGHRLYVIPVLAAVFILYGIVSAVVKEQ